MICESQSFRTIPIVKDKSSKILPGSSSTNSAYVAGEVGVAVESQAQSSANVDIVRLCGNSSQSNMESQQLPEGLVYDCDGSQWWVTWRAGIGCMHCF
jgi:hypothetical protein